MNILEEEIDLDYEIETIMRLYDESRIDSYNLNSSLEEFFDQECIHIWKNRKYVTSSKQMRERLRITDEDIKMGLDDKQILILLEYILNVMSLCDACMPEYSDWNKEFRMLEENIINIVNGLNYEIKVFEEDEKIILVEKSAAATAVAEIMEAETAYVVIEYNHYLLKGDLTRKKQILKVLADKFEGKKQQIKSINNNLVNEIGCLLNKLNIRHNNLEGSKAEEFTQQLSSEQLEAWYDDTYQLLLLAFLEEDNLKRRQRVKELQRQL
ncbi:MAG: hypothetical protein IKW08_06765 [Roseburia sp.]|nr:hypothetical protein [Roseburia sp.]